MNGIQNSEKTETIEIIQKELYELKMNYYALKNENIELKKEWNHQKQKMKK